MNISLNPGLTSGITLAGMLLVGGLAYQNHSESANLISNVQTWLTNALNETNGNNPPNTECRVDTNRTDQLIVCQEGTPVISTEIQEIANKVINKSARMRITYRTDAKGQAMISCIKFNGQGKEEIIGECS